MRSQGRTLNVAPFCVLVFFFSFLVPGSLCAESVRPLTPDSIEWGVVSVDLGEHFTDDELTAWRSRSLPRRGLSLLGIVVGLAFYLVFLVGPLGRSLMRRSTALARSLGQRRPFKYRPLRSVSAALIRVFGEDWTASLIFTLAYLGIGFVVALPLWILGEILDQRAGLSQYTAADWVIDLARGELLGALGVVCMVLGLFGLVRRLPRSWWLVVGVPAGALLVVQGLLSPAQVRMAHRVEPLTDGPLRQKLEALVRGSGLELSSIRVVEASRVTSTLDARLMGVGPTRELLLFDTLVEALDHEAIEAAVAHELGHERRQRPLMRYGASALGVLLLLFILSRALLLAPAQLGLSGPGDVRALPLVMLIASLFFLAARPARLAYSRYEERLADRAALTMTGDPEAFIRLQVSLVRTNQTNCSPTPLEVFWFASHPSVTERIGTALWYQSWLGSERSQK